ncbi:MAG TPA: pyridoxal phosphate-dependent aminotransferase [Thermoanaerobaculia bacterium]
MAHGRAPYMEWAKSRRKPEVDLAGSNLLACGLDDLPGAREALDIAGESPNGYPPLVEAIARRYGVASDRVATAGGCSGANFLALAALVNAGDEILIERPAYDPLIAAAKMLGAHTRFFERRFEDGYALDPDRIASAIGPMTRVIVITDPHNPTGVLATEESLSALARLAASAGLSVLVDEVYQDTVLGQRRPPAATRSPVFVSTNSLTKAYGLASLRCGWALASPDLSERIRRARDVVDVWAPMPSDRMSVIAFQNLESLAARAHALIETNAGLVAAFFSGRPDLACVPSRATIAFPRLTGAEDAGDFARRLLEKHGTAVAPGAFFGAPAHFRISFGGATDRLAAGLEAIARCLDEREE